ARAFISPEIAIEIQTVLGGDIAMTIDECVPYPCQYDYAAQRAELTTRWAKRCKRTVEAGVSHAKRDDAADTAAATKQNKRQLLFGIVQGATFEDLRKENAQAIVDFDFDGYANGGVSVGEPEREMQRAMAWGAPG